MTWPFGDLEPGSAQVILADPPWRFSSNSKAKPGRNAMRHYPTMTLDEICALPVRELAADVSMLALWITGPLLVLGHHVTVMRAWGFKPAAVGWVWIKLTKGGDRLFVTPRDIFMGGGFTTRKNAEFCLIGKRGRSLRKNASVHEVIISPVREHSRKPDEARERIEQYVGPGLTMVELFARTTRPGWLSWGNQVGILDER
jgi:N6-adenosine-specific RNA methylase IME4